jgi:predicted nuclease of restriction endonuclease-like (RecB) superfamily
MTNLNQESNSELGGKNSEFRIQNSELKDNSEFRIQNSEFNFGVLAKYIEIVDTNFRSLAQKQVNISYTVRNWFIGYYILSYEQKGKDRAEYGTNIIGNLSKLLKDRGLKGFSITNLKLFRQFYQTYPEIGQSLPDQLKLSEISQSLPDQLEISQDRTGSLVLINNLSFTHIIELLKINTSSKRSFYELEAIKNSWSVRDLARAINSMLYERLGLSSNKVSVLNKFQKGNNNEAIPMVKNPYILEFLGIEEKVEYSESDLEQAIINHLQKFLMELGHGICFEARQKRITFDNTHYYIDLVFYHRILKCNILIDLKLGEFNHSDAGQMNLYLNYYKDNELSEGDNDPIGIILCANKNEQLVKYATGGLSQKVFVSKYLINLPKEEELKKIIIEEQNKQLNNE